MASPSADLPLDSDLVAQWRAGEEVAAQLLFRRHVAGLSRYLRASGAKDSELDDLVQDTFIRAFRHLDSWRGEGAFRSWLFRIGTNLMRDGFRKSKGRIHLQVEDQDLVDSADPAGELVAKEGEGRLEAGIASLPRMQREVFLLRAQQGLGYQEIAVALETSPGAARVHYHQAVKRLKEWLE